MNNLVVSELWTDFFDRNIRKPILQNIKILPIELNFGVVTYQQLSKISQEIPPFQNSF